MSPLGVVMDSTQYVSANRPSITGETPLASERPLEPLLLARQERVDTNGWTGPLSRRWRAWQNGVTGISIKNEQTERLARELARETGESLTTAIRRALEERLERLEGRRSPADRLALARAVMRRVDALPILDDRPADEILGYDEHGLP
jgi:antitoxin VapB